MTSANPYDGMMNPNKSLKYLLSNLKIYLRPGGTSLFNASRTEGNMGHACQTPKQEGRNCCRRFGQVNQVRGKNANAHKTARQRKDTQCERRLWDGDGLGAQRHSYPPRVSKPR